jgi:hypothetical protein
MALARQTSLLTFPMETFLITVISLPMDMNHKPCPQLGLASDPLSINLEREAAMSSENGLSGMLVVFMRAHSLPQPMEHSQSPRWSVENCKISSGPPIKCENRPGVRRKEV